jgi:6-pyruvoyl-tetrahydropterin synthase
MVLDFGLVKKYIHPFVDSFDHSHMLWLKPPRKDLHNPTIDERDIAHILSGNERWILAPFSSTAEMQAQMFWTFASSMINVLRGQPDSLIQNDAKCVGAIVHETDTGYAYYGPTATKWELRWSEESPFWPLVRIETIEFSEGIKKEWPVEFRELYDKHFKA